MLQEFRRVAARNINSLDIVDVVKFSVTFREGVSGVRALQESRVTL